MTTQELKELNEKALKLKQEQIINTYLKELNQKVTLGNEINTRVQQQALYVLSNLINNRNLETGEHVARTRYFVKILAQELKKHEQYKDELTDERIEKMVNAAPLHDVGKIKIPDEILLKPGRLTPEEFDTMKLHSTYGGIIVHKIFSRIDDEEFLQIAENIATFHHERWDGRGYPKGLKGEEIPLEARIMAVADVYDALISDRVYKKAVPPAEALDIIISEEGHFDPNIIEIVKSMRDDLIYAASLTSSNTESFDELSQSFAEAQKELISQLHIFDISLYDLGRHMEDYFKMTDSNYHAQYSVQTNTKADQTEEEKKTYNTQANYSINLPNGQQMYVAESTHSFVAENLPDDMAERYGISPEKLLSDDALKETNINLLTNRGAHIPSIFNPDKSCDEGTVNAFWYAVGANLHEKTAEKENKQDAPKPL